MTNAAAQHRNDRDWIARQIWRGIRGNNDGIVNAARLFASAIHIDHNELDRLYAAARDAGKAESLSDALAEFVKAKEIFLGN